MCCFGCTSLKKLWRVTDIVKVSTPVIEFHPITEQERLFAKKLLKANSPQPFIVNRLICEGLKLAELHSENDEIRYFNFYSQAISIKVLE